MVSNEQGVPMQHELKDPMDELRDPGGEPHGMLKQH